MNSNIHVLHVIRLSKITRDRSFYRYKIRFLNLSLQSMPSNLQFFGIENSLKISFIFYDEENFK